MTPERARSLLLFPVAALVTLGWFSSLGLVLLGGDATALTACTPVMLIVAGFLFGATIVRRAAPRDD